MITYELVLDDGLRMKVTADFVDVLDGPSRCVRFVRQLSEEDTLVYAIYFGVKSIEFLEFTDVPVKKTKTKRQVTRKREIK